MHVCVYTRDIQIVHNIIRLSSSETVSHKPVILPAT